MTPFLTGFLAELVKVAQGDEYNLLEKRDEFLLGGPKPKKMSGREWAKQRAITRSIPTKPAYDPTLTQRRDELLGKRRSLEQVKTLDVRDQLLKRRSLGLKPPATLKPRSSGV